jgi:hypothetical protein
MKQFCKTAAHVNRLRATAIALFAIFLLVPLTAIAQSNAVRSVEGKVYGSKDTPQSSAVVYLQDSKTNNIKSFISTQDGSYRFGQLSSDIDYQLWAEYKGQKSDKKTISSFNSKKVFFIDLHLKD